MSIIEFLITWAVLIGIFLLGYFARKGLETFNEPETFKHIISGPVTGGTFDGRYVMRGLDDLIHYARPPFILTLEE